MQTIRPLDAIIRKVPSRQRPQSASEKDVMIDCKTKKVVSRKSWFGEVQYFIVVNNRADSNPVEYQLPSVLVRDIENDRSIELNLKCWISCPEGNEERVAESLFDLEQTPSEVFDRTIRRWVDEFVGSGRHDFIQRYFEVRSNLVSRIVERAFKEMGLVLQLKVSLDREETSFRAVEIATEIFLVRVKDFHEQQDLRINCQLEIDPATKIYANVYRHKTDLLEKLLVAEAKSFFGHSVTLEQFYDDLNQAAILDPLKASLNAKLAPRGRKLGFFHLASTASDSAPKQFENELAVIVKVQEYPEPITIKNHARMTRRDVAIYKAKDSPKLDIWLKHQLQQIIPDVLFYKKYIDLLIDFHRDDDDQVEVKQNLKSVIKQRLSSEAKKIGYEVKYLTTIPNLKPLTWLEPFTIGVEGSFETRISNFFVKLSIPVTLRLETLEEPKIRNLLNRLEDIPERMREKVLSVTSQYLHSIDPEQFYTTFSFASDKYKDQQSVEQELISRITASLQDSFAAEVISVVPKIVDTEPIIRWRELQEKVCDFSLEVTPLRGGEPVLYSGKFQVEAIAGDGWYRFQSKKFTIDEIRSYLEDHVRARLKTAAKDELLYKGGRHLEELQNAIARMAMEGVQQVYGVVISISMIDREFTRTEAEINTEIIERDRSAILIGQQKRIAAVEADAFFAQKKQEEVKLLIDERLRLGADAPDDQIKEFEDRIKAEREKLNPDLVPSLESVERMLRPDLPGEDRLIEFSKFRALPAGSEADISSSNSRNGKEHEDE